MTTTQIKTILERLGVNYSESNIQIPQFSAILGSTNQGVDYRKDFFTFDFDAEVVKIKRYIPKAANGRVSKFLQSGGSLRPYGPKVCLSHPVFPFRNAKSGDYVFGLNKQTLEIETEYLVLDSGVKFIVIDSDDTLNQKKYCYLYSTKDLMSAASQDPVDKSLYLVYEPLTDYDYDLVIDMNQIIGFEIRSERVGND